MRQRLIFLLVAVLLSAAGCRKASKRVAEGSPSTTPAPALTQSDKQALDACSLITREEVGEIIGSPITATSDSTQTSGAFQVSQCFYTAAETLRSATLMVTRAHREKPAAQHPKDFWREKFSRFAREDDEAEGDSAAEEPRSRGEPEEEENERRAPPVKIAGLADEAFWTNGQLLYVLQGDAFIRISVGGADPEPVRIEKSKALAAKALMRVRSN